MYRSQNERRIRIADAISLSHISLSKWWAYIDIDPDRSKDSFAELDMLDTGGMQVLVAVKDQQGGEHEFDCPKTLRLRFAGGSEAGQAAEALRWFADRIEQASRLAEECGGSECPAKVIH